MDTRESTLIFRIQQEPGRKQEQETGSSKVSGNRSRKQEAAKYQETGAGNRKQQSIRKQETNFIPNYEYR